MPPRNAVNFPGLRFGVARALGHGLGRSARWFNSLGVSWRISLCVISFVPPVWFYRERQKAKTKTVFYNRAVKECVFLDFAIGNRYIGRVLIGLYSDQVPLTCENFIQLAQGYRVRDKVIGYRNTDVVRVYPDYAMVAGDVVTGDGSSQLSIYGPKFADENFDMDFVQDGDVCMFNTSPHSNGSQFMITFRPVSSFYGYSVVFGTVLKGMRVVRMIEDLGTQFGMPRERIRIVNCGLYRSSEDGPPFFNMPEILDRYDQGPLKEGEFQSLSEPTQQRLVEEQRQQFTKGLNVVHGTTKKSVSQRAAVKDGEVERSSSRSCVAGKIVSSSETPSAPTAPEMQTTTPKRSGDHRCHSSSSPDESSSHQLSAADETRETLAGWSWWFGDYRRRVHRKSIQEGGSDIRLFQSLEPRRSEEITKTD